MVLLVAGVQTHLACGPTGWTDRCGLQQGPQQEDLRKAIAFPGNLDYDDSAFVRETERWQEDLARSPASSYQRKATSIRHSPSIPVTRARVSTTSLVPTSANAEHYARIVLASSIRRMLAAASREIISRAYDGSLETQVIVKEAETKIFEISDRNQTGTYAPAKQIVQQTFEALERHYHSKSEYTGIPSGFRELDQLTMGFQSSEFIVIGARPSVGKTAFALSVAANMALQQKIAVGFFSLEMSGMAIMQRLLSMEARLDSQRLRTGMLSPADFSRITEAAGRLYEAPLYISDSPDLTILDLRVRARRMMTHQEVRIIFVDYITLISPSNRDLPRHEQIAEISRSLKALARELGIPVVALSQVRRESEGKRPNLADLRESGSIEQDADVVIFIHTEDLKAEVREVAVAKQRNGPVGEISLAFLTKYTRFEALERGS